MYNIDNTSLIIMMIKKILRKAVGNHGFKRFKK